MSYGRGSNGPTIAVTRYVAEERRGTLRKRPAINNNTNDRDHRTNNNTNNLRKWQQA